MNVQDQVLLNQEQLKGRELELKRKEKIRSRWRTFLAFLSPLLILILAFAVQKVFPFGDRHILTVDLYHQYAPFLSELREKLLSSESLFFSWSGGLGINFFALFSYYLASPLNLITVLFPRQMLSEMVLSLVLLKVGLSGLTFHIFLKKAYRRDGPIAVVMATAYALNSYVLTYFWNIMWLDTIVLLPLLALGLVRLVRENKGGLYLITLALTIYCNYYTGFFVCIFIAMYYFSVLERFSPPRSIGEKVLLTLKVMFYSFVSVLTSMITLLPTYYALTRTSAAGDSFPQTFDKFNPFFDFINRFLPFSSPNIRRGMANIYFGLFAFLLLLLFFLARRVPEKRKWLNGAIIVFLLLSYNNNYLNFIWHGFHYPNQLPYRNSFLICFFALALAYDSLPELSLLQPKQSLLTAAILIFLLIIQEKVEPDALTYPILLSVIVFLLLYAVMFSAYSIDRFRKWNGYRWVSKEKNTINLQLITMFLIIVMLSELIVNSVWTIDQVSKNEYFGLRDGYRSGELAEEIMRERDLYQADRSKGLVRMEVMPDKCVNDSFLYGTNGLTVFASTFPKAPVRSFAALGFANNGINSFQYYGSTPVMDKLFGIRYIMRREPYGIDERMKKLISDEGEVSVWEYEDALPIAYLVDEQVLNSDMLLDGSNFFDSQGRFIAELSGEESPFVNKSWELDPNSTQGMSAEAKVEKGDFTLKRNSDNEATVEFTTDIDESGSYYIGWRLNGLRLNQLKLVKENGEETQIGKKGTGVTELGYLEEKTKARVKFRFTDGDEKDKEGSISIFIARLDEEKFKKNMQALQTDPVEFLEMGSRSFTIKTNSSKDKALFVATTEDPGWSCEIDGVDTSIQLFDESFLIVPVASGEHIVSFKFTPQGFYPALYMSIAGTVIIIILIVIEHRSRQKKILRRSAEHA